MISRVLVPMDESEMAERALRFALEAHPDAEIIVLPRGGPAVVDDGGAAGLALADDTEEAAREQASDLFERAHGSPLKAGPRSKRT